MHTIAIFCKTFRNDIDRFEVLLDSIFKFNKQNIPFYIIRPPEDKQIFEDRFGKDLNYIDDSEVLGYHLFQNWATQGLIRHMIWELDLAENFVLVDSDSYFIKDFYVSDFMCGSTPYAVCHERKDFWLFCEKEHDSYDLWLNHARKLKEWIGREGPIYDFLPPPTVWSRKVWEHLMRSIDHDKVPIPQALGDEFRKVLPSRLVNYIKLNEWTRPNLLYGEFLLRDKVIPFLPRGPYFLSFDVKKYYDFYKQNGFTEDNIRKHYFGVLMNSSWDAPLKY